MKKEGKAFSTGWKSQSAPKGPSPTGWPFQRYQRLALAPGKMSDCEDRDFQFWSSNTCSRTETKPDFPNVPIGCILAHLLVI